MNLSRFPLLLLLLTPLALGQAAHQTDPVDPASGPEALVRSLFTQVVVRHPTGIPYGADMKVFTPYLSKTLLHRIDLAIACGKDWYRQHPGPTLKPPFAWLESGLFSGQDERTEPNAFVTEKTEPEKDGSFRVRVYVKLNGGTPPEKPWVWQVAAVVVRENGHFVIDDVIYLKDKYNPVDSRLSEVLSGGCDGPRWVGFGDNQKDRKPQK